jgi:hypothetical protein
MNMQAGPLCREHTPREQEAADAMVGPHIRRIYPPYRSRCWAMPDLLPICQSFAQRPEPSPNREPQQGTSLARLEAANSTATALSAIPSTSWP